MGQGLRKKGILIITLLISVLFFSLFYQSRFINAQGNGLSLDIPNKFDLNEYSNINGSNIRISVVNISLPSTDWNITKVNLKFSNLTFYKETVIIEDQSVDYERVYYQNPTFHNYGLATQIKLNERATIYGVFIYGRRVASQDIQVQIQGYNGINNTPNGTILASTIINMSSTNGWYFQNFSIPITLPKGNYFLVLNGTNLSSAGNTYYWYYNSSPKDPSLNSSSGYETSWIDGVNNKTFLYKLNYKVEPLLYPDIFNMSVKINNQYYKVLNGTFEGYGYLTRSFFNYFPDSSKLTLPVHNNISNSLKFNLTYHLNLEKVLTTQGITDVEESKSNQWILYPNFNRQTFNYSVKFDFPKSWSNISVLLDEQDLTTNVTIDLGGRFIFIPNNTITQDSGWELRANSPNILFNLSAPKTEFNLGQELRFSLEEPIIPGNYTFILIDSADIEETRIKKIIPIDDNIFSYELPTTSPDGTYIAYVFWNNETDAGAQSQEFLISSPNSGQPPDLSMLITIIILSIVVPVSGISIYIGAKRIVKKRKYNMERLLNKCIDILNLNYLIVTDNKSGLDVYTESYGDKKLDSSLISGFLQAVREFGTHVAEKDTRIVKLDYKDTIILMKEFVNIRLILNMKDAPSEDFIYSIESLAYEIYKRYGDQIENFRGNVKKFSGIKNLIEKHLNVSFLLPFKVVENPKIRLSPSEKAMVNKAIKFVKDHKFDYFYSLYLLPANECTPKDAETILNLIEKGIFKPIK